jgi:uncharacterized protein (DUF1810 family)
MDDAYDLQRFVTAQDDGGTYDRALAELRRGRKTSHWMWFVLPQLAGLGHSPMARAYAISSLGEARAYLAQGGESEAPSAEALLGAIDAVKLRSSMTLFASADPSEPAFRRVLERYFDGLEDERTLELL